MKTALTPIETKYDGCLFRSRLEARWAVFFNALDVQWNYELEGFQFSDGSRYLPDFYLPTENLWIEIKPGNIPNWIKHDGQLRLTTLPPEILRPLYLAQNIAEENRQNIVILYGEPRYSSMNYETFDQPCHYAGIAFLGDFNSSLFHESTFLNLTLSSLAEFLQERGYNAPTFDNQWETAQILLDLDRQYFKREHGYDHPKWVFGLSDHPFRWFRKERKSIQLKIELNGYFPEYDVIQALNLASSARFGT